MRGDVRLLLNRSKVVPLGEQKTLISVDKKYKNIMNTDMKILKREEIFTLAQQARLMLVDGDVCYLNDMATDRELIALVRLIESALQQPS